MRKLIYEGFILTNADGLTDTWKLTIGEQSRVGSLFELRRQVNFFLELGVLPPMKDPLASRQVTVGLKKAPPISSKPKMLQTKAVKLKKSKVSSRRKKANQA